MTEVISILFFIIGIGVSFLLCRTTISGNELDTNNYKLIPPLFFIFLWNSEYIAAAILFFALMYYKNDTIDFQNILRLFFYTLVFTVLFRKVKDAIMQYFIELNLEHIK